MNREQLIAHTQKYMLALSQGVDPISGLPIQEGDAAAQPRLKKCFAYVAELLGELLDGRGYLPLTDEDAARQFPVRRSRWIPSRKTSTGQWTRSG